MPRTLSRKKSPSAETTAEVVPTKVARKAPAKKAAARKTTKKAVPAAKKTAARKPAAEPSKATAKKAPTRKAVAKKTVRKAPARKTAAKKTTAKKSFVESPASSSPMVAVPVDTRTIREWATSTGQVRSVRGPLPQSVIDAYHAAHGTMSPRVGSGKTRLSSTVRRSTKSVPVLTSAERAELDRITKGNPDLASAMDLLLTALARR